ncbi:PRELI-like family-domain-containing protein [Polychytrium aggregatum]|uniref:PRELI-like family-domain-containing protein n=1 Tax=Polychytrium aggregatum TaxID=110093 RepID=UPI0022FEFA4E|nr:PRELI-like family-domain-containing protein [Polychytrium aggregatum]KAI9199600.1 PRELI-like family-domain-containing protein [Polychytrium aggregatum]
MVQFFKQELSFDHSWSQVTLAIFRKYPNPFASHVLASDVIDRVVDPATGVIYTTRLFLKKGLLPKWGRSLFKVSDAFIIEHSTVDPRTQTMTTVTKNLSHTKLMLVEETQVIRPHPETANATTISSSARIVSNTGWDSLKTRIEGFGVSKFKDNTLKSARGLRHVLEQLTNASFSQ